MSLWDLFRMMLFLLITVFLNNFTVNFIVVLPEFALYLNKPTPLIQAQANPIHQFAADAALELYSLLR